MPESRRAHLVPAAGILLLGLLAYANSLRGDFVFDDIRQIRDNPVIRDLGSFLWSSAGYRFSPSRFVAYLTFALNYRLGGLDVFGWHAVNLAIHLAVALVLYALVASAFRAPRLAGSRIASSSRAVAFAAAALFVTHPIETQAVSYVVQRITSLAALFYLLAMLLYLRWRLQQEAGDRGPLHGATYLAAVAAALLAVRTKEIAFTLPAAVLLLEAALFGRPGLRRLLAVAPFVAAALWIPATLLAQHRPAGEILADVDTATRVQATGVSRLDYLRTEVAVVAGYLRLLVWPAGLNLDHDVPLARSFLEPRVAQALVLHLALLATAAWAWRRTAPGAARAIDPVARLAAAGVLFFYLALSVESSLIPIADPMFEHRAYLPSAGFFAAVAVIAALALRALRPSLPPGRRLAALALALAIPLAFATLLRNRVWWTDVTLWTDAVSKSPGKARPQLNLGTALVEAGRPREAVGPLREAARLAPELPWARAQLGATLLSLGRLSEAEAELRAANHLAPGDAETLFNLGMLLARTGRREEARPFLTRFVEVAVGPGYTAARRAATAMAR